MKKQNKRSLWQRIRWSRVGFLLLILLFSMSFAMNALADSATLDCENIIAGAGDTLWGLIKEVNPDYTGNMNEAVYKTCRLNDMTSAKICVGQNLLIPNL